MHSSTLARKSKLLNYSYNLLSKRDYTEKQLRDKLKVRDSQELVDSVISNLKERGYIDDARFARNFVETKSKFKGLRLIRLELFKKGVDREIIESEISDVSSGGQIKLAERLLFKKVRVWQGLDERKLYQRSYGYLARRGFDSDQIRKVVEKMLKKRYN